MRSKNKKEVAQRAVEKSRELATATDTHALGPAIEAYLGAHEVRWSENHVRGQERFAAYWKDALGEDSPVESLTPAIVEAKVRPEWSARTTQSYLKFMRSLSRWLHRKARFLVHDVLDGITLPRAAVGGTAYSTEELDTISGVAPEVGEEFSAIWEIVRSTGRRLSAVRTLRAEDLQQVDGRIVVTFQAETDKARRRSRAFLSVEAQAAVERLGVESGYLFLMRWSGLPCSIHKALEWLREAEKRAGVAYLRGRGFHGVKRRVVTELLSKLGDADLVGRVTGTSTTALIEQTYRQQSDADLLRVADLLDTGPPRSNRKNRRKHKRQK